MTLRRIVIAVSLFSFAAAQEPPKADKPKPPADEGIPVTSQLVIDKCGACHTKGDKGNLTRISWERATPEGWQQAIKRMVRLNGLQLTPDEARQIVDVAVGVVARDAVFQPQDVGYGKAVAK